VTMCKRKLLKFVYQPATILKTYVLKIHLVSLFYCHQGLNEHKEEHLETVYC